MYKGRKRWWEDKEQREGKNIPPQSNISSLSAFKSSICCGLLFILFSSASAWSGTMTSHSGRGVVVDAIVRYVVGTMTRTVGLKAASEERRSGRKASIYTEEVRRNGPGRAWR
jgi:hypothetical protein